MDKRFWFMSACAVAMAFGVWSQEIPPSFQASFVPEGAMYPREQRIEGMTLSIWGENPQSAFALGFVNGSTGQSSGMSLGLLNYAESYTGVHWGFVNLTEKDFYGWQGGPALGFVGSAVNYVGGEMQGFQSGVVNLAGRLGGAQLGLINYAQYADRSLQIGLINVISQNSGWFTNWPDEVAPGMILVNWRY